MEGVMLRRALGVFVGLGCALLIPVACTNDFDALLKNAETDPGSGGNAGICEGVVVGDTKIPAGLSIPVCGTAEGCAECNATSNSCTFGCHLCGANCNPFTCTESSCQAHCAAHTSCDVGCGASSFQCEQHCTGCIGTLRCAATSGTCSNQCTENADCDVVCTGSGACDLTCKDSQCTQDCQNGNCSMSCDAKSTCATACANGAQCDVTCGADAKCILDCAGQPNDCSLTCAKGQVLSCSNGRKVCGYDACPP